MIPGNRLQALRFDPLVLRSAAARLLSVTLLTASCSATSCQSASPGSMASAAPMTAAGHAPRLEDYVDMGRKLTFTDVWSSAFQVGFGPGDGFVVADNGQSRLRVFSGDGRLRWATGQRGGGPSEFQRLRAAVRNSAGDVIAIDNAGKLAIFDSLGARKQTALTHLSPTYSALLIDDTTLLISGRREGQQETPLLHLWNLRTGTITRSFFETPAHPEAFDEAYRFSGWASAAYLGNGTLAVTFALTDTLFVYGVDGRRTAAIPLELEHFRRIESPGPRDRSPQAELDWRGSYSRITDVFRAPDQSIYIQYANLRAAEPVWGLARFELSRGTLRKRFEVPDSPLLLGISPRDGGMYFLTLDDMDSTEWTVGHLLRR